MMEAIEVRGLTKQYGHKIAVNKLCISVKSGELFSLLGVNGAGKTTTIRLLSCLARPTAGDAVLLRHSIRNEAAEVKAGIGVSPQETAIAPNLSVRENLELMAGIHGFGRKASQRKAKETIELLSLSEIEKQKSKTLSGGYKRRLSIAMALISQPQILFLDEPTLGLDVLARRELWNVIQGLKGRATIVLTTHYLEEAESLSDRIGIMRDGSLKALGTAEELKRLAGKSNFEDAFVALAAGGDLQ